jgi:hypothetical protein
LENAGEMGKFLDRCDLPKLNQEDISNQNIPYNNETEVVIKSLPTKKSAGSDDFPAEFYQTLGEGLTPVLLKLFHRIERVGLLPLIL